MNIQFATCERHSALEFLKKLYPSQEIADTAECAGPLLDLVEADIVRITDPSMHQGSVVPGKNWDESRRQEVIDACMKFHK